MERPREEDSPALHTLRQTPFPGPVEQSTPPGFHNREGFTKEPGHESSSQ